jgi:hypothetical protein
VIGRVSINLAVALSVSIAAAAQQPAPPPQPKPDEVPRGETVLSRPRPDYDPLGIRLGGFMLLPDLTLGETYNSNLFATRGNKVSDFITSITPTVDLRSNWNNHALNFHFDTTMVRHVNRTLEDYNDFTVGIDGRLDILHDLRVFAGTGYRIRHEGRDSPNDLGGREPTEYDDLYLTLAGEKEFNRLSLRLDGAVHRYTFRDVVSNGGFLLQQSLRDRDEERIGLKLGYELAPLRQVYAQASHNWRNYDAGLDISGFNRDSTGYSFVVGTDYDLTGIIFINAFVGYRQQDYEDPRLSTARGPTAGATLTWNVTRLTTVTGRVSHDVQETVVPGASSYFATVAQLRVDHELLRNLILNASVGYENDSFEGISRDDNYYSGSAGARYLINNNFSLSGGYSYRNRDSSSSLINFDEHLVFIRLSSHL